MRACPVERTAERCGVRASCPCRAACCGLPMFDRFSDNSKRLMSSARREAIRLQHGTITPEHMLLGLLQTRSCRALGVLAQCGVDSAELYQRVQGKLQKGTD